ncbi:unnamed protein product [Lactuca saligna]|uniref:Uncharacterized protein n=1 Tax=Lactuca saligna TaxID=75948 RepID=A0AA35ZCT4_LACSI|nr:unnamed protein product [Lactuca saligna]
MALGSMPSSRIYGGHRLTRLALSYEVDTSEMVHMPIQEMCTTIIGKMQVEPKDIHEPAFERHQRPRNAKPDQLDSTLRVLLGMDHPPFPHTDATAPPSAQPGHHGVGPSGTYHGDTNNDNDGGMGDKEGEYESNNE